MRPRRPRRRRYGAPVAAGGPIHDVHVPGGLDVLQPVQARVQHLLERPVRQKVVQQRRRNGVVPCVHRGLHTRGAFAPNLHRHLVRHHGAVAAQCQGLLQRGLERKPQLRVRGQDLKPDIEHTDGEEDGIAQVVRGRRGHPRRSLLQATRRPQPERGGAGEVVAAEIQRLCKRRCLSPQRRLLI